jgi:YidC/Oxa1 family membrane protein insertase
MLMYVFPIMFAVFGINFPVGVLVYWLTTNAWTMGQQLTVIRRNPTPGSKAYVERQARLKAKGKLIEPADVEPQDAAVSQPKRQQPKRQTKAQRQAAVGMAKQQSGDPDQSTSAHASAEPIVQAQQKTVVGQTKPTGRTGQGDRSGQVKSVQDGKGQPGKRNKPRQPTGSRPTKK